MSPEKLEEQHKLFVLQSVESGQVWGLHCKEGWANADSCEFEEVIVYPFWSSAELAQSCAIQEWKIYQPKSLDLAEFLENWCVGMYKEYILAGINWNEQMEGKELDSLDLALQIIQELKRRNVQLKYKLYKNQAELERVLLEVITDERHSV
jgi:hypothetical protein